MLTVDKNALETEFDVIIGLETHIQLSTASKMFCSCSADYANAAPNSHTCPICLGMPGVLPVINSKAIEYIVRFGLALNCNIPEYSKFDRKNYFYPDLVKGYQISQFDLPVCVNGWVDIEVNGETKRIGITRVHQEEDTGKLVHMDTTEGENYSLVDYNRCGVPLMECVSEPDIRSAEEAREYLTKLRQIVRWLGIGTGNMEEGAMRCDANISIMPKGSKHWGTKVEIKNMNSINNVYEAIKFELKRQAHELKSGRVITQHTRGWDEETAETVFQRSKENSNDYRYFPEPDLPPLQLVHSYIETIRASMPEMPDVRGARFIRDYSLSPYDATLLTSDRKLADWFEEALGASKTASRAKFTSNWILNELFARLKETGTELAETKVKPSQLADLIGLVEQGTINNNSAKVVFDEMFATGKEAEAIVKEKNLAQISDEGTITAVVGEVIQNNPKAVADYKAGNPNTLNFLIGQVMKATRGTANKDVVRRLLEDRLA
jgi:aspartyl-tRNA(Asn)/glutamyl-tRNA(Gln) amidotransferase subunit B